MDMLLLATKLQVPLQPRYTIQRARLNDIFEVEISQYKLVLLAAPAGYGKTTQLAQWVQASQFSFVWFSIDQEDNNLIRFLRYLLAGWENIQPSIRESSLGKLLGARSPDSGAVLSAFINAANNLPDQLIFILDDYHLISDESIHRGLAFLLDHAPPR